MSALGSSAAELPAPRSSAFASASASALAVERLRKSFGGVQAVDDVSFTLQAGEIVGMIGPNGAGKSTLFNLINGQLSPDGGRVLFNGHSLAGWAADKRARRGIGRTFQVAQTFATMTALQNVQLALAAIHQGTRNVKDLLWDLHADAAQSLLAQVGLQAHAAAAAAAADLAYGDVKRLELALALAARPQLLLMDEPTAGMAPEERFALMRLTVELARARSMTVLFTEHSIDVVFGFADRVLVLSQGRLAADGAPDVVRANDEVQRVYLGDAA